MRLLKPKRDWLEKFCWSAAGAILLVLGWFVIVSVGRSLSARGREYGRIAAFREDCCPSPDGARVVYSRALKDGVGLFFYDIQRRVTVQLCFQREAGWSWQRFGMLGWSPGGQHFVFTHPTTRRLNEGQHFQELCVADGTSGRVTGVIAGDPDITQAAWLDEERFATFTYNQSVKVCTTGGTLVRSFDQAAPGRTPLVDSLFTAVPNGVAWVDEKCLWHLDFDRTSAVKVWQTQSLDGFSYDSRNHAFVVMGHSDSNRWFITVTPAGREIYRTTTDERPRYAVLRNENGVNCFYARVAGGKSPVRIEWDGIVEDHIGSIHDYIGEGRYLFGNNLLFVGNPKSGIQGLQRIDLDSGTSHCLVSALHGGSDFILIPPAAGVLTNRSGIVRPYHVWQPILAPGRKYPIILGQEPYRWNFQPNVAAQNGYWYAMVARKYWSDESINQWKEDVSALLGILALNPAVDTNRVYLMASSWESNFAADLFERNPQWPGLILFDPLSLPAIHSGRGHRYLVVAGDSDPAEVDRLSAFQEEGYRKGAFVRLILQHGVGHVPRSEQADADRAVQFRRFLLNQP
ncbi:MAG: hypothetical protein U1F98_11555 [Verrucomicrobiota bacterium]